MTEALSPVPGGALWLPGSGVTGTDERAAAKAVEEYDSDYTLGQRQDTGEWVVFLKVGPHDGQPFPVFGLGTELPAPETITRRLYQGDLRRHGSKIVAQITRRQDEEIKARDRAAQEADGVVAEAMEYGFRKQGVHPSPRIFVPGRD